MAKTDLTKNLLTRFGKLKSQRANWENHWQEVADYMQPRKADVTKRRSRGDKRNELIFDSSPIQAVELLASSLHGMLTNPSTPWFTLRFKEDDIENEDEAKIWLESATAAMYTAFNRSNFQQEIFELYHDLITFGTAAMFIEEDDNDIIKFSTRHINEVFIAENDKGRVDTIFRRFKISARAAIQKFGDKVSSDVQGVFKKDPYAEVEILHAVYPRSDFDPKKKDKSNMPFESIYLEYKNANELSVSGFKEFPFVVPRYLKASNEIYGVYLNDKAIALDEASKKFKATPTDVIIAEVKGRVSTEKHEKILWEKKFEIIEIISISSKKETNNTLILGAE